MNVSLAAKDSLFGVLTLSDRCSPACDRGGEDAALIKAFLARGADRDFERLVDRYKERVHRLVASVLGPGLMAEAEGVTQEVFIQVFRKLATFRMESSFSTWLYRIAFNRAAERRQKARFRIAHQGEEVLRVLEARTADSNPAAVAATAQQNHRVVECLEELSEPQRTAVYLYYWMKYPVAEIAAQLGVQPGTVKSYLHRARARLARSLKEEGRDG
jgi:RNA polymerase sigma-70 factor (ECF subfamily)